MKKKITALVLCVVMLSIAVAGGTLAYFTDTKAQTNTFTAGKVEIYLDEAVVVPNDDGNLVKDGDNRTPDAQSYHLYPAQTVTKDPTIYVDEESENCYLAAKITITSGEAGDIETLISSNYQGMIDISLIVSGGFAQKDQPMKTDHPLFNLNGNGMPVYGTTEYSVYQEVKGNGVYVLYLFVEGEKEAGYEVTLFDTMTIPAAWDNAEMAIMNGTTIKVEAFATQANGFDNCFEAITTAFPTQFDF